MSWWEMENFSAYHFYEIAKQLQYARTFFSIQKSPGDRWFATNSRSLTEEEKVSLWQMYDHVEVHCKRIRLAQSVKHAQRLKVEVGVVDTQNQLVYSVPGEIQTSHIAYRLEELDNRITDEMKEQLFVQILPRRVSYITDISAINPSELEEIPDLGSEIKELEMAFSRFPNAKFDLHEAGNCFGYERFTACVHHLVRAVEFGLVSLAVYAGVEGKDQRNWNTALNAANKNLRDKAGNFSNLSDSDQQYWSEAIGLLRNFNTAWRNPSSHIPTIYDETKAKKLFSIAKSTMDHLGQRLSEVPMPE